MSRNSMRKNSVLCLLSHITICATVQHRIIYIYIYKRLLNNIVYNVFPLLMDDGSVWCICNLTVSIIVINTGIVSFSVFINSLNCCRYTQQTFHPALHPL